MLLKSMMNILILDNNLFFRSKSKGPVCLLNISAHKTVIEKQIEILNQVFPKNKIIIITGTKSKKIEELLINHKNISIVENKEYDITNCLFNIKLGIEKFDTSVLIIPSNIIFNKYLFKNFNKRESQILLTKQHQEVGCIINNSNIENIMWGLPNYWTKIAFFINKEFELLKYISSQEITKKWFFLEGINFILEKGANIKGVTVNSKILVINKLNDIKK